MGSKLILKIPPIDCDVCAQLCANKPFQYACTTCPMTNTVKLVMLTLAAMTRTLCERFQSGFLTDSSSIAIDHVSLLESYHGCKDFWVVIDFLYFVSQSLLLSLANFTFIGRWECGCALMPFSTDPTASSSSHGQWSGLACPGLIAYTHPFQPNKICSLF